MNRRLIRAVTVIVVTLVSLLSPSAAAPETSWPTEGHETVSPTEVSRLTGIAAEEIETYNALLQSIVTLQVELRKIHDFGGLWVTWTPLRVHVASTSQSAAQVGEQLKGFPRRDLVERSTRSISEATLYETASQIRAAVSKEGLDDVSIGTNVDGPRLTVSTKNQAEVKSIVSSSISANLQPYITYDSDIATPNIYGGFPLANGCTGSFPLQWVFDPWAYTAIMSAAHCPNTDHYIFAGDWWYAQFDWETQQYHTDAEVYWVPDAPFEPYVHSAWGAQWVGRVIRYNEIPQGGFVCHHGNNTGSSCGTINSTNYSPSYVPNGVFFIKVSHSSGANCADGDSGGPWWWYYQGYGVHSGSNNGSGDCIFGSLWQALVYGNGSNEWFYPEAF